MRRDVLAALRAAQGQLTSLDVADQVVATRKLAPGDVGLMRKPVGAALWKLGMKEFVEEVPQAGD